MEPQKKKRPHVENSYPYYSAVRFQITTSLNAGVTTYTYAQGTEVQAFNYGIGQSLSGAGYSTGNATMLETNLIKQSETLAGETVKIFGLSFLLSADADAEIARQIFSNVSVRIGLNGDQQLFKLGPLSMLPGGGGLHGVGRSYAVEPPLTEQFAMVGSIQNGLPGSMNFYRLPTPILWSPPGGSDSSMTITCRCERAISYTTTNRTASAPASGSTGTIAYTAPVSPAIGTHVTGWFVLRSVTAAPRSKNN